MKKLLSTLIFISFVLISTGGAQTTLFTATVKSLFFDFSKINSEISEEYHGIANQVAQYKLGRYYKDDRGAIGLGFSYFLGSGGQQDFHRTFFEGVGISSNFQYNVLSKKNFTLHLGLEAAIRKYNLILAGFTGFDKSIKGVLSHSIENYSFINKGVYLDFDLGINKYFSIEDVIVFGAGVSVGYRFDTGNWRYEGINHLRGSVAKLSGMFVSFNLKFNLIGAIKKKQKAAGDDTK